MAFCVMMDPGGPAGGMNPSSPSFKSAHSSKLVLCIDKILENAQTSGELDLGSRNLKTFPKSGCKYRLKDTVVADMSRNKLTELPQECTDYYSMERLVLYHNMIRTIPDSVVCLHSLQFLDLSRNQLSYLPDSICQLPSLQVLVVNNNRLVSLPEEVGKMQFLTELDASCNEITHLPVQIGDMVALRSLNLRRNHLQEIPVEISFLRLVYMDLSANRISTLPVELRFMISVVDLNLGENPLTCPPANLCSRGKVHVFKHLEIQAIKEDRKRGVLTDSEYRRSYRHKTTAGQLNDFRFANGFGADARRKRHTADSGYGSEQPLDRRWSQDFSQDAVDMHTEDARRIILRAANAGPRSPQKGGIVVPSGGGQIPHIVNIVGSRVSASAATPSCTSPPITNPPMPPINQLQGPTPVAMPLPPLTSTGSSGSSSGHSSMSGCTAIPPISSSSSNDMSSEVSSHPHLRILPSSSSPSPPSSSSATSSPSSRLPNNHQQKMLFAIPHPPHCPPIKNSTTLHTNRQRQSHCRKNNQILNGYEGFYAKDIKAVSNNANEGGQLLMMASADDIASTNNAIHSSIGQVKWALGSENSENESVISDNDVEKEERRKAAQKVLGKQGNTGPVNNSAKPSPNLKCQQIPSVTSSNCHVVSNSPRHAQPLLPPTYSSPPHPCTPSTSTFTTKQGLSSPINTSINSMLPIPISSSFNSSANSHQQRSQIYSHRHFKEQLRRQNGSTGRNLSSPSSPSGTTPVIAEHQQQCQLQEVTQNQTAGSQNSAQISTQEHQEPRQPAHATSSVVRLMQGSSKPSIANPPRIIHSSHSSSSSSSSSHSVASSATNSSTIRLQASSSSSTSTSSSSLAGGSGSSGSHLTPNVPTKKTSSYDVKAFQKEAVLSYIKAKQSSPAHSVASLHHQDQADGASGFVGHRSASTPPRPSSASTSRNAHQLANGVNSLINSHRQALAQHNANNNNSSIPQPAQNTNGLKQSVSRSAMNTSLLNNKMSEKSAPAMQRQFTVHREEDKSASADSHISQLKMHIESRLRISLPENLSTALADGVILCHVANHVRPRAVPSIHVPSPAVPKLNVAKCRRNVENFLLACKKIGVREDLICSPSDLLEPRRQGTVRVAITVSELLRFYQTRPMANISGGIANHLSSGHLTISGGVHL